MICTYSWFIQAKGAILCSSNLLCFSTMTFMFLVWLKQISDTSSIWLFSRYNSCKCIWKENLWKQNNLFLPLQIQDVSFTCSPYCQIHLRISESICSWSVTSRNAIFQSSCLVFSVALKDRIEKELYLLSCLKLCSVRVYNVSGESDKKMLIFFVLESY